MFKQAKELHASGKTFVAIATEIGVGYRTIAKWVETDALPHRRRLTLKPSSPLYFQDFLFRRWADGGKVGRRLFHDIRHRGYNVKLPTPSQPSRGDARTEPRVTPLSRGST